MNLFILGVITGIVASLAVAGIIMEMKEREKAKESRLKYADMRRRMKRMRMTGMTLERISKRTGVPVSTVHRYVR
tara:strand:- start:196 stop:420 length:225 start_codon:yes stop_codon:yes gene_type:complete